MLSKQENQQLSSGKPVCSSQLDVNQLHNAIKEAYYELDKNLKKVLKDDSGCVCVNIFKFCYSFQIEIFNFYLDNMFN